MININEFTNRIYQMSEKTSYNFSDKFETIQGIDETVAYVYIKAFYVHVIKLYLEANKNLRKFEEIYYAYKMCLENFYRTNVPGITRELVEDIKETYDKSFEMMQSLKFKDLYDGYEFRHHIVDCFELLRSILENKSKKDIRVDIFEDYISTFRRQADEVIDYVASNMKGLK